MARKETDTVSRLRALLGIALVTQLAFAASGCGDDGASGDGAGSGGGQGAEMVLVPGIKGDDFYTSMGCGAQAAARKLDVKLNIQAPKEFSPTDQTPIVDSVGARRPDALLIAPTDTKALYAPIKRVADGGTKVVLVDTTLDNDDFAVSRIRSDYLALGRLAGKTLFDLIGGKGKVLAISLQPGVSTLDAGIQGFQAAAKQNSAIEYLGVEYAQGDQSKVASIVNATLARDPDLAGIFTPSGPDQAGVINALRRADKTGDVKVVSADAQPPQVEQLRKGEAQALIAQKPFDMGRLGVEQAAAALADRPVKGEITTGLVVATKKNLDQPEVSKFLYQSKC